MRKSLCSIFFVASSRFLFADAVFVTDFDMMGMMGKVSVIDSTINAVVGEVTTVGFNPFASPYGIAVSPDGSIVAVADRANPSLYFIDASTYAVTHEVTNMAFSDPITVTFTPDASKVVMPDQGGSVFIVETTGLYTVTPVSTGMFMGFTTPVGAIISLDGSTAYVADRGNANVYIIDIASATVTGLVSNMLMTPFFQSLILALSTDGTFAYLTDFMSPNVFKIDMTAMPVPTAIAVVSGAVPPFAMTTTCAITPDDSFVYVLDYINNRVYQVDAMTSAVTTSFTDAGFSGLTGLTILQDGSAGYLCCSLNGKVFSFDTATNTPVEVTTTGFSAFINPALAATTPASFSSLMPPTNLNGRQIKADFAVLYYLSNTLTWGPSPSGGVAGYNIYRNGLKIGSVTSSILTYIDNTAPKGINTYAVRAFNSSGTESQPISIQVQ